jgi:phospholipase/lecithinase/hemolysin
LTFPNPYVVTKVGGRRLIAFGDSYTDTVAGQRTYMWPRKMVDEEHFSTLTDMAEIGATCAYATVNGRLRTLRQQVALFKASGIAYGANDATVIYFGQNDINQLSSPMETSLAELTSAFDKVVVRGATAGNRRVLVALLHDITKNPNPGDGPRMNLWWSAIEAWCADRQPAGVTMVDIRRCMNDVYAHPHNYGLVNVSEPHATRSSSDYLYKDIGHYGAAGQRLLSKIFAYHLSTGWDLSTMLVPGSQDWVDGIEEAIATGKVFPS